MEMRGPPLHVGVRVQMRQGPSKRTGLWGVIPSPLLKERSPEPEFRALIDHLVETAGSDPVILVVSDMALRNNPHRPGALHRRPRPG